MYVNRLIPPPPKKKPPPTLVFLFYFLCFFSFVSLLFLKTWHLLRTAFKNPGGFDQQRVYFYGGNEDRVCRVWNLPHLPNGMSFRYPRFKNALSNAPKAVLNACISAKSFEASRYGKKSERVLIIIIMTIEGALYLFSKQWGLVQIISQ